MLELTRQQKQEALDNLIKKLRDGQVPLKQDTLNMGDYSEAVPLEDMTPEKVEELKNASRNPASKTSDINSDMVAVPLEQFMPKGSYMAEKGKPGQEASPDITGTESAPELDDKAARLAKIKALFQKK